MKKIVPQDVQGLTGVQGFGQGVRGPTGVQGSTGPCVSGPTLVICPRCHIFKEFHRDDLCVPTGALIDAMRALNGVEPLGENRKGLEDKCSECDKEHAEKVTCESCGGCLYKYASQKDARGVLFSDEHPIVECTNIVNGKRCGKRRFWG